MPPEKTLSKYLSEVSDCRDQICEVIRKGRRIIYCDETVFTKRTYATKDYAGKHQIIEVDEAKIYAPYVCALAAVSAESPIELVRTFT